MNVVWHGPIVKKDPNSENNSFKWPSDKGVYVIANDYGKDIPIARYVGKGIITDRIQDHKNSDEECMKEALDSNRKIYYAFIDSDIDRSNIEHTLYNKYGGEKLCNENEPEGKIIDINYPPDVVSS